MNLIMSKPYPQRNIPQRYVFFRKLTKKIPKKATEGAVSVLEIWMNQEFLLNFASR